MWLRIDEDESLQGCGQWAKENVEGPAHVTRRKRFNKVSVSHSDRFSLSVQSSDYGSKFHRGNHNEYCIKKASMVK